MRRRLAAVAVWLIAAPLPAAAAGGPLETGFWDLFWHAVNLALLVGLVVYFGRAPIRQYFRDRRARIRENLDSSAGLLTQAEAKLAEWQGRLQQLDSELAEIRSTSARLADAERERVLADARASAERIGRDAKAAVDQELRRARAALRREASDLAIELAERLLREQVTPADRERLLDEFVTRVETSASPPGAGR